ncbi:hypothetical protein PSEUBRA_002031 [Kalmanozyma brasiliensis GHG001]|uniref:uncharacterized protein n=1 Tax=Kalmanozyma brasiliensis (strain GHG001) TaxID=1365824 RepID=UPI001CE75EBB|nr:uncharacterized protein PSEUBRA_002031 [Kalmanozyma brasiliensis GHG001]EST08281.2 hypothetical protein PSEUBRA_002031 [Kalmanozyma brasiliensis GHG001]
MVDLAQSAGGPTAPADPQAQRRRKSYMQGLVLLLIVVVLWTASNFLTNALLTTGGYDKPFFVTYANTSSFALYLIPYLVSGKLRRRWRDASSTQQYERLPQQEEAGPAGEEVADDKEELPRWLKTLGFDVPTVTSEGAELVVATEPAPAIKPFAVLAQEQQQRGRGGSQASHRPIRLTRSGASQGQQDDSSTASTPLLAPTPPVSRPSSPVRPYLVSTAVPRPSSIDGRRPRTSISIVRPTNDASAATAIPIVQVPLPPLTLRQTAVLASQFTLVWFGANWAINAGLGLTSVASGTTIGSASGFFTLALGAALGVDRFTLPRLGAVCISALGVAAVTFADRDTATSTITPPSSSAILDGLWSRSLEPSTPSFSTFTGKPPNAPLGDLLALLSAFLYSLYVMLLKTRIGSEDRISMPLMFGIVGAINVLCLWPILPLLHFTGVEPFALPPSPRIWAGVVVNMCITFVSDFIYLLAMLKSSPLITTLGLSLTIPLAVVIDAMKGSHTGGTVAVIGSTAVLSSFGFIGWDDHRVFQEEKRRALAIQQVVVAAEERGRGEAGPRSQLREEVGADDRTVRRGDGRDSSAVSLRSASSLTSSGST